MLLPLTCALLLTAATEQHQLHGPAQAASNPDLSVTPPSAPPPYAVFGSGDGEPHQHEEGNHMTAMWVVMGAMMAMMVVGAGFYMMRTTSRLAPATTGSSGLSAPAAAAIPPPRSSGG